MKMLDDKFALQRLRSLSLSVRKPYLQNPNKFKFDFANERISILKSIVYDPVLLIQATNGVSRKNGSSC